MFKNRDLSIGYIILMIPLLILGSILHIHQFLLYVVYIPLFILCKLEDSGYTEISNINESNYFNELIVNQIGSKMKIEPNQLGNEFEKNNIITIKDSYIYKNYKVDYKLYGYPNVVREYVIGNNLYEIQRKYMADPKVSKLIRVIEIS